MEKTYKRTWKRRQVELYAEIEGLRQSPPSDPEKNKRIHVYNKALDDMTKIIKSL